MPETREWWFVKIDELEAELQAAQERERALRAVVTKHETVCPDCNGDRWLADGECEWCGATGTVCDDLTQAWADVRALAAQRTEEARDG